MHRFKGSVALLAIVGFCVAACAATPPAKVEIVADARIDRWDPAMDAIVPKDAKIEKLAEGFGWAEGPIWVKSGNYLLFTDVPGNKMWKWSEKGGLEKFLDPSGAAAPDPEVWREAGANGITMLDANTILYADTGNRVIHSLDLATKKKTVVASTFDGKKFSSPNDVTRMKNGVLFFTNPPYGFKEYRHRNLHEHLTVRDGDAGFDGGTLNDDGVAVGEVDGRAGAGPAQACDQFEVHTPQ